MPAQTVLEELTQDELTRDHVMRRVDDWVQRIGQLYAEVESWLPANWTARRGTSIQMHEPLMKRMGIKPRELPTLELVRDGQASIIIRPLGLWVIGTNGRMDLVQGQERFVILDHAMIFETPDWRIAPADTRQDSRQFDTAWLTARTSQ